MFSSRFIIFSSVDFSSTCLRHCSLQHWVGLWGARGGIQARNSVHPKKNWSGGIGKCIQAYL